MILVASNIDVKQGLDNVVTKAWISKLDQVYQRAEITMGRHPDFMRIKNIYDCKKKELKKEIKRCFGLGLWHSRMVLLVRLTLESWGNYCNLYSPFNFNNDRHCPFQEKVDG